MIGGIALALGIAMAGLLSIVRPTRSARARFVLPYTLLGVGLTWGTWIKLRSDEVVEHGSSWSSYLQPELLLLVLIGTIFFLAPWLFVVVAAAAFGKNERRRSICLGGIVTMGVALVLNASWVFEIPELFLMPAYAVAFVPGALVAWLVTLLTELLQLWRARGRS